MGSVIGGPAAADTDVAAAIARAVVPFRGAQVWRGPVEAPTSVNMIAFALAPLPR